MPVCILKDELCNVFENQLIVYNFKDIYKFSIEIYESRPTIVALNRLFI